MNRLCAAVRAALWIVCVGWPLNMAGLEADDGALARWLMPCAKLDGAA
jgi:hypothetical protein